MKTKKTISKICFCFRFAQVRQNECKVAFAQSSRQHFTCWAVILSASSTPVASQRVASRLRAFSCSQPAQIFPLPGVVFSIAAWQYLPALQISTQGRSLRGSFSWLFHSLSLAGAPDHHLPTYSIISVALSNHSPPCLVVACGRVVQPRLSQGFYSSLYPQH